MLRHWRQYIAIGANDGNFDSFNFSFIFSVPFDFEQL
jgi:hypothetical protein